MTHNGKRDGNGRTRVAFCWRDWAGIILTAVGMVATIIVPVAMSLATIKAEVRHQRKDIEKLSTRVEKLAERHMDK